MAGTKRCREEDPSGNGAGSIDIDDHVHRARKPRVQYGEANANLAEIYNRLRDELPGVRTDATARILRSLIAEGADQQHRFDNAITRLIKGTCSGAKAARLGFSMALSEVLRLGCGKKVAAAGQVRLQVGPVVEKIVALSNFREGKLSGEEKRNLLLGRCFALQAILQSGVLEGTASLEDVEVVFGALADLAAEKQWLRMECGAVLRSYLSDQRAKPNDASVRSSIASWSAKGLLKSPEGVALWLIVKQHYPNVKLPKGVWHHNNPLSSQERPTLTNILIKNEADVSDGTNGVAKKAGARQVNPSFAWSVLLDYFFGGEESRKFANFWSQCVASAMFSTTSSTERKALGLQVFTLALKQVPGDALGDVLHPNIIRCIIDQRSKPDRLLFEATKQPLNQIVARAKEHTDDAAQLAAKLLQVLPGNVDKLTRTTLDAVLGALDVAGLTTVIEQADILCRNPDVIDSQDAEKKRRFLGDVLLQLVRTRRGNSDELFSQTNASSDGPEGKEKLAKWAASLLKTLVHAGYYTGSFQPSISDSSRVLFRERLASILGDLLHNQLHLAVIAPQLVVRELYHNGGNLAIELREDERQAIKSGWKLQKGDTSSELTTTLQALRLLLYLGILQVYRQEPDAVGVLEDIITCYQTPKDDTDSNTMLVELLLSFISKQSALFRRLAEQVFSAFATEVSEEGLQSMIDILSQKEGLAGQQELFDQNDEDAEGDQANADPNGSSKDEEDVIDVEDASDVDMNMLNGDLLDGSSDSSQNEDVDDDESEDGSSDSPVPSVDGDDAELKRKAAAVLGTAGGDGDSSDDGSEMDDDQMIEADKHLITFFQEQKKVANKKQENKDAKANIVNFKNRVLDLLHLYVKSQYASVLALDLILPLVTLTRITTNPPTAKKAYDVLEKYFDTAKKHKAIPQPPNSEDVFAVLSAIHEEIRLGGSKLHANACSRASQFLAKVVITLDEENYLQVDGMYSRLKHEWRRDAKSRVPPSVFNDWHSWSMQR